MLDRDKIIDILNRNDFFTRAGRIDKLVGMTVESNGPPCNVGDVCRINIANRREVLAEVVGFKDSKIQLMPFEELDGIGPDSTVISTGGRLMVPVGEELVGRTINALGQPIDGRGDINCTEMRYIDGEASNPMDRPGINKTIEMGVRAIDGFLTIGKGQRMGIFAGSGVGKSTLMGMLARNVKADVNVIALVGERGREVVEFIERDLGEEGAKRSVLVVATSDQPAMMRSKCALTATTIAEYFRDMGLDVLLMMDSLTRYCMAQREIGLSVGEPPVARGYTPSMYKVLPRLLERAGNFKRGSITGIYTVLVEGDDANEPVSDTVRGIIDGHIMLSRKLAAKNHYPAIDVSSSISRLMNEIASGEHREAASILRNALAVYEANIDLISIGAYKSGSNKVLDDALERMDALNAFLCQETDEKLNFDETIGRLLQIAKV